MTGEREHLRTLALKLGEPPASWLERLEHEEDLDRLAQDLKAWWREKAWEASYRLFRSPLYRDRKPLPHSGEALYTYERSLWPVPLEERARSYHPPPPGWDAEPVVARSRRAALWTLLVTLRDLLEEPGMVRSWGLPPSSVRLLDLMAGERWRWSPAFRQATLLSSLRRGGVFLVASMSRDGEALAEDELVEAWSRPGVLVVDTTLTAHRFDFPGLLERLSPSPLLAAQLQSLLPFDQLGLELAPAGLVTLYTPGTRDGALPLVATAAELARRTRSLLGTALSYPDLCLLDVPFLFDRALRDAYAERVLANNERLAEAVGGRAAGPRVLCPSSVRIEPGPGGLGHRTREIGGCLVVEAGWRPLC